MGTQAKMVGEVITVDCHATGTARSRSSWAGLARVGSALLALGLLGVGCGSASDPGAAAISSLTMDDGGLPLLDDSTTTEAWWLAPPGCEGLLRDEVSMAIASLEHGLVAALDPAGHIVCVDTVEAVGEELDELGRHEDATALSARFAATVVLSHTPATVSADRSRFRGDPNPEPNGCLSCGDPNPEPNIGPTRY